MVPVVNVIVSIRFDVSQWWGACEARDDVTPVLSSLISFRKKSNLIVRKSDKIPFFPEVKSRERF